MLMKKIIFGIISILFIGVIFTGCAKKFNTNNSEIKQTVAKEEEIASPEFTKKYEDETGISFMYPNTWVTDKENTNLFIVDEVGTSVNIVSLPDMGNIETGFENAINSIKENYSIDEIKIVDVTIGGYEAKTMEYIIPGFSTKVVQCLIYADNRSYALTLRSYIEDGKWNEEAYKQFNEVLKTIEFK